MLSPVKRFGERFYSMASAADTDIFLNATERLNTKPLADSRKISVSFSSLQTLHMVLLIACALSKKDSTGCFFEVVNLVRTLHIRYEDELNGTSWIKSNRSDQERDLCNLECSQYFRCTGYQLEIVPRRFRRPELNRTENALWLLWVWKGFNIQCLSLPFLLDIWNMTSDDISVLDELQMNILQGCEQDGWAKATCFKRQTNTRFVPLLSNVSKLAATSPGLPKTCYFCEGFLIPCTLFLELQPTPCERVLETWASVSGTVLLLVIRTLCCFRFLLWILRSMADIVSLRVSVRHSAF